MEKFKILSDVPIFNIVINEISEISFIFGCSVHVYVFFMKILSCEFFRCKIELHTFHLSIYRYIFY